MGEKVEEEKDRLLERVRSLVDWVTSSSGCGMFSISAEPACLHCACRVVPVLCVGRLRLSSNIFKLPVGPAFALAAVCRLPDLFASFPCFLLAVCGVCKGCV
jgi:hypothetical protein